MKRLLAATLINGALVLTALAQPYGIGNYGDQAYQGTEVSQPADGIKIGPVTLPATGPQLALGLFGIGMISGAAGIVARQRQRRKK